MEVLRWRCADGRYHRAACKEQEEADREERDGRAHDHVEDGWSWGNVAPIIEQAGCQLLMLSENA